MAKLSSAVSEPTAQPNARCWPCACGGAEADRVQCAAEYLWGKKTILPFRLVWISEQEHTGRSLHSTTQGG